MTQATRATLYLGANIDGKPSVTSTDFAAFLEQFVTPHFPGFTVRDTVGYWKGKPEHSRELVIIGEDGASPFFYDTVEWIADAYKTGFRQEAVMISYEPVSVLWDIPTKVPYHLAPQFDVV